VSVGVFRSNGDPVPQVVALGQTLPNTEIVLTDLRGQQAELMLDDTSVRSSSWTSGGDHEAFANPPHVLRGVPRARRRRWRNLELPADARFDQPVAFSTGMGGESLRAMITALARSIDLTPVVDAVTDRTSCTTSATRSRSGRCGRWC
jgi:hypothetical protein